MMVAWYAKQFNRLRMQVKRVMIQFNAILAWSVRKPLIVIFRYAWIQLHRPRKVNDVARTPSVTGDCDVCLTAMEVKMAMV